MPFIRKNPRTVQIGPYAAPSRTIYPGDGTSFVLPVGQTVDYSYGRVGPKTIQVVGSGVTSEVSSLSVLPDAERSALSILSSVIGSSSGTPTSSVNGAASVSVSGTQYLFYQRSFVNSLSGGKVTFSGLTADYTAGNYVLGSALSFLAGSIAMPTSSLFIVGITVATGLPACVTDFSEVSLSAVLPLSLVSTGDSGVLFSIDINADIRVVAYRKEVSPGVFSTTERWLNVGEDPRAEIGADGSINLSYYSDGTRRGRKLLLVEESQWSFLNRYIRNASTVTTGGYGDGTWFPTYSQSPLVLSSPTFIYSGVITANFFWVGVYNPDTKVVEDYVIITKEPNQYANLGSSRIEGFTLNGGSYNSAGLDAVKVAGTGDNLVGYSGYFVSSVAPHLNTSFSGSSTTLMKPLTQTAGDTRISDGVLFDARTAIQPSTVDATRVEYKAEFNQTEDQAYYLHKAVAAVPTAVSTLTEYKAEFNLTEDLVYFSYNNGPPFTVQTAAATIT